ncbi:uncharacterized transmembrane protein DDB_G0289901 isoform X1 [Drosophila nasuta]|uniref:uncharacterized transmembrane protein DDB_G0289901 isoform X1 n=1 Tax=Drosophila nasuta TaxID=42062 RepID=UPI00295EF272|nr:uncharacterized transmembrane protein DDB_G0289901 isoform X1 [Drosophila nasuta]
MSSAVNIQIVSMPNLAKIENFLKDVSYRETIEYSANFNTRLCIERRLRLPFLDPQTGVAQNHSQLFMDKRQRMPGFRQGQIYTYPATRWRKSRRQYLSKMYSSTHNNHNHNHHNHNNNNNNRFPERPFQALRKEHEALVASGINIGGVGITGLGIAGSIGSIASGANSSSSTLSLNMLTGGSGGGGAGGGGGGTSTTPTVLSTLHSDTTHDFNGAFSMEESCSLGAAGGDTSDSKDSQLQTQQQQQQHHQQSSKDELPKEWFYDEMDMNDVDSLEEPKSPADDEYDYDPRYGNKKRRKRRPGKRAATTHTSGDTSSAGNSSAARRRSAATRTRIATTDAALDASLDAIEAGELGGGSGGGSSAANSGGGGGGGSSGRRSRVAGGTRGRRRANNKAGTMSSGTTSSGGGVGGGAGGGASGMPNSSSNTCDPPSPGLVNEPPSFESAAAAVGVGVSGVAGEDGNAHLRNYRKYL